MALAPVLSPSGASRASPSVALGPSAWPVRSARPLGPCAWPASLDTGARCRGRDDDERLTAGIIARARAYGRYGTRTICARLQAAGWLVNATRVERTWRRVGLKAPAKQPHKGRLWLHDGASRPAPTVPCVRLRPQHPSHVWSCDVVEE